MPSLNTKPENIGGGTVRRGFQNGKRRMLVGEYLKREEILAMPAASRNALIENGYIETHPPIPAGTAGPKTRFVVRSPSFGSKTFDVIEGDKIAEGISKEEADALAAAVNEPPAAPKPEVKAAPEPVH